MTVQFEVLHHEGSQLIRSFRDSHLSWSTSFITKEIVTRHETYFILYSAIELQCRVNVANTAICCFCFSVRAILPHSLCAPTMLELFYHDLLFQDFINEADSDRDRKLSLEEYMAARRNPEMSRPIKKMVRRLLDVHRKTRNPRGTSINYDMRRLLNAQRVLTRTRRPLQRMLSMFEEFLRGFSR